MLSELVKSGYGDAEDYNCAEKILYGANIAYNMGLPEEALKVSAGFGGGMAIESVCGALTAGVMTLSLLFVQGTGHKTPRLRELVKEFLEEYRREMGDINCAPLKKMYRTEELKCRDVILKAAEVLDRIVERQAPEVLQGYKS